MHFLKCAFIVCLFAFASTAQAEYSGESDAENLGDGFVAFEGGYWVMAGQSAAANAYVGYLTIGMSLSREFGSEEDAEAWRIGPKIGFGFGKLKSTADYHGFYDAMLKIRYTAGQPTWRIRPYFDAGPGVVSYIETSFQLEAGTGIELRFSQGSIGVSAEYKEVVSNRAFHRGVALLGSLGFHF